MRPADTHYSLIWLKLLGVMLEHESPLNVDRWGKLKISALVSGQTAQVSPEILKLLADYQDRLAQRFLEEGLAQQAQHPLRELLLLSSRNNLLPLSSSCRESCKV